jgi:curved DNA-binding protein CbpA
MRRTYYDELGVPHTATTDQIQDAYFKLARRYHPDVNKGPTANERMAHINLAYETLSDPERRSRYDSETIVATPGHASEEPRHPAAEPDTQERRTKAGTARRLYRWMLGIAAAMLVPVIVALVVNDGPLFDDSAFSRGDSRSRLSSAERCWLDYGSYYSGWPPQTDTAMKQQLDACLLEAKGPTPAPENP